MSVKVTIREIIQTVLFALVIFLVLRVVIGNYEVEYTSMEPNLHPGQRVLVNKLAYPDINLDQVSSLLPFFHPPQRGDIVLFPHPQQPDRTLIKRVIGLPGETIEIRNGYVYIDGIPLEEPYISEPPRYPLSSRHIPIDHYFVLGDNRNISLDSRQWGPIPRQSIIGQAWLCYWPLSEFGLAPNYPLEAVSK